MPSHSPSLLSSYDASSWFCTIILSSLERVPAPSHTCVVPDGIPPPHSWSSFCLGTCHFHLRPLLHPPSYVRRIYPGQRNLARLAFKAMFFMQNSPNSVPAPLFLDLPKRYHLRRFQMLLIDSGSAHKVVGTVCGNEK